MLRIVLPALFVLVLAPRQELVFAPVAGATLETTFERSGELEIDSFTMLIDGEEMAGHGEAPELQQSMRDRRVFVDHYAEVADGRVTRFTRSFEEIESEREERVGTPDGLQESDSAGESELEGASVEFTWDEDEYAAAFAEDGGDEALLENLWAECDFRAFLPDGDVDEDDTWEVPAAAFALLVAPGGDLKIEGQDRNWSKPVVEASETLEGDIRCSLGGSRDEDGSEVWVVNVEAELASSADNEVEGGEEQQEIRYELEGELLWDAEAGRLFSLELSGDVTAVSVASREVEMGDRNFDTERTITMVGQVSYAVRVVAR